MGWLFAFGVLWLAVTHRGFRHSLGGLFAVLVLAFSGLYIENAINERNRAQAEKAAQAAFDIGPCAGLRGAPLLLCRLDEEERKESITPPPSALLVGAH